MLKEVQNMDTAYFGKFRKKQIFVTKKKSADGQLSSLLSSFFWQLRSGGGVMFELLKDIIFRGIESAAF